MKDQDISARHKQNKQAKRAAERESQLTASIAKNGLSSEHVEDPQRDNEAEENQQGVQQDPMQPSWCPSGDCLDT